MSKYVAKLVVKTSSVESWTNDIKFFKAEKSSLIAFCILTGYIPVKSFLYHVHSSTPVSIVQGINAPAVLLVLAETSYTLQVSLNSSNSYPNALVEYLSKLKS